MKHYFYASQNDDALAHAIAETKIRREHEMGRSFCAHAIALGEKKLLNGNYESCTEFMELQLASLRQRMEQYASDHSNEIEIEVGYSLTALFAAYYAVLVSPNVMVHLSTAPAFGGETLYARTHPHLIQKLLYIVLAKAKSVTLPNGDSEEAILEAYPRLDTASRTWVVKAVRLPDSFMPVYEYVRDGILVFAEFERGGGVDHFIHAFHKVVRIHPELARERVTLVGTGDQSQAGDITTAFPHWKVIFNAPIGELKKLACQHEIAVLPDEPDHTGPTIPLFAAIGAGCAIIAREGGAARAYAGTGALIFPDNGDPVILLANALVRALADPATRFNAMARTMERRDLLRKDFAALEFCTELGSHVTEAEQDGRKTLRGN